MKKAYLYIRISSDKKNGLVSIKKQLQALKDYVQKKNCEIIKGFKDWGSARAYKRLSHKEMRTMIQANKKKYLNYIVTIMDVN